MSNSFVIEIDGCDRIEYSNDGHGESLRVVGCSKLLKLLSDLKAQYGNEIKNWILPAGESHEALMVREMILRVKGEWDYPYKHEELCHCRNVKARTVDQAILLGAHTPAIVSRRTSASTACGTCRLDVQKVIDYRLQKNRAS